MSIENPPARKEPQMSDLIEAMARGYCADGGYDPDEIMANGGERWCYYVGGITAALAALRETHHLVPKDQEPSGWLCSHPGSDKTQIYRSPMTEADKRRGFAEIPLYAPEKRHD